MSYELRQGYDVKLKGRSSRYRVAHLGPYNDEDYPLADDEFRAQRMLASRPGRKVGRQRTFKRREIEALCTGKADNGYPIWREVIDWHMLPRMRGWFCMVAGPAFTTHPTTVLGVAQQAAMRPNLEIVWTTPPELDELARLMTDDTP